MASLVGGVICSSVLPLTLATVLAYVITGYIRNELYCAFVKTYIGYICNGMVSHGSVACNESHWSFLSIRQL